MSFSQRVNRVQPMMPTRSYKTFAVKSPINTHFRRATCAEVSCAAYAQGWTLRIELLSPELLHLARTSGKRFTEVQLAAGHTVLVFEAGQPCFAEHKIPLGRPEIYLVGRGDWRSFNPRQARQHTRPEDWVDECSTHLDKLRSEIEKG